MEAILALFALVSSYVTDVRVTYYLPTGDPMYNGQMPFVGAAACGWNFPLGTTVILPDGWSVKCLDRGMLDNDWVDIYMPSDAAGMRSVVLPYGDKATVVVIE